MFKFIAILTLIFSVLFGQNQSARNQIIKPILVQDHKKSDLLKCAFEIINFDSNNSMNNTILVDTCHLTTDSSIILSNYTGNALILHDLCNKNLDDLRQTENLFDYAILSVVEINNFYELFFEIYHTNPWTAKVKPILIIQKPVYYELLRGILHYFRVTNFAVCAANNWEIEIFTVVNLLKNTDNAFSAPVLRRKLGKYRDGKIVDVTKDGFFVDTLTKDMIDTSVKLKKVPPFYLKNRNGKWDGITFQVLTNIYAKMGIALEWCNEKCAKDYSNTYEDLLSLHYATEDLKLYVPSVVYYIETYNFWVPSARQRPIWTNLMHIFEFSLILLLFLVVAIMAIFFFLIQSTDKNRNWSNLSQHFFMVASIFLSQGVSRIPSKSYLRILIFSWIYICFIISSAFQAKLVDVLTNPSYEKQIKTFKDIMDHNLSIKFTYDNYVNYFKLTNSSTEEEIVEYEYVMSHVKDSFLGENELRFDLQEIIKNRTYVLAFSNSVVKHIMPELFLDDSNRELLCQVTDRSVPHYSVFLLLKTFPFFEEFNRLLLRQIEGGIVDKIIKDIQYEHFLDHRFHKLPSTAEPTIFSIQHLLIPFLCLAIGHSVATATFFMEIGFNFIQKRKRAVIILN